MHVGVSLYNAHWMWIAGYIGLQEFHLGLSPALVALDTFSSQLLMVLFINFLRHAVGPEHEGAQHYASTPVSLSLPAHSHAARTFTSVACAALQRRHLMIWAVFAPKFILETSFSLVTQTLMLLAG